MEGNDKPNLSLVEGGTDNVHELKQSSGALEASEALREAVVYKGDEIATDNAGAPVFKDQIEWEATSSQIRALWSATRGVLEHKLAPPMEADRIILLMEKLAKLDRPGSSKPYRVKLEVNYFVGMWHCIDTCVKVGVYNDSDDKGLHDRMYELALWVAKQIDLYHEVKRREKVEDDASPNDILQISSAAKQAKILSFKKKD